MEYFDVLDKNRKPLGYTKQRGTKLEENEYNMGIEIWIFNDKKLLLTQRSMEKSHPLEWEVPGGCSQTGETSIDTLEREVKEEIGVDINNESKNHNYITVINITIRSIITTNKYVPIFFCLS